MTGVSYMLPFVAAGGLLIALGFLFGGYDIALAPTATRCRVGVRTWAARAPAPAAPASPTGDRPGLGRRLDYLGAVMFTIGGAAFGFLVPALSGYIAYALAGRPGIAPGFVGGAISVDPGRGFLGGILTGLVAGVVALWLANLQGPRAGWPA
jgi:PTS system fructose-specific IIC component